MSGSPNSSWLAWGGLLAMIAGMVALGAVLTRQVHAPSRPTTEVEGGRGWPRTLVERLPDGSEGRRLVLETPPQRIVSVTLATDEILVDLVAPERIVALSEEAPGRNSLAANRVDGIEHFVGADVESILALRPDLCFLASYNREETRSLLVESGVPIYVFRCFASIDDIRDNIQTVGRAVGAEQQAARLLAEMDRKLLGVAERLPPREEWPSVLVFGRSGWVAGKGTVQTDLFENAGLRNAALALGFEGYSQISEEQVLELAPQYFVVSAQPGGAAPQRHWLLGNPALATLEAIRRERFLVVEEPLFSTVSHHIADAVAALARQAHPDRFDDD